MNASWCRWYLWRDGPGHFGKEAQHSLGEGLVGNVVLQQQDLLLGVLVPSLPQTAHKVSLEVRKEGTSMILNLLLPAHASVPCQPTFGYLECLGQPSMATMIL